MNKPLSEWTLAEVKAECKKHTSKCADCLFWADTDCRIQINMALADYPEKWDLSEPPRWTEQEVKDAKAIQRILPEARDIERITETLTVVRDEDGFCLLTLQKDMFPNVKDGPAVKLADIIGGNE